MRKNQWNIKHDLTKEGKKQFEMRINWKWEMVEKFWWSARNRRNATPTSRKVSRALVSLLSLARRGRGTIRWSDEETSNQFCLSLTFPLVSRLSLSPGREHCDERHNEREQGKWREYVLIDKKRMIHRAEKRPLDSRLLFSPMHLAKNRRVSTSSTRYFRVEISLCKRYG